SSSTRGVHARAARRRASARRPACDHVDEPAEDHAAASSVGQAARTLAAGARRGNRVRLSRGTDKLRSATNIHERGGMMRGRLRAAALAAACFATLGAACSIALGGAQAQPSQPQVQLDFYSAQVSASQYADLLAEGYDVSAARDVGDRKSIDLVLSPEQ